MTSLTTTCACGDVLDEHVDDDGCLEGCQVEGCDCIYFESQED